MVMLQCNFVSFVRCIIEVSHYIPKILILISTHKNVHFYMAPVIYHEKVSTLTRFASLLSLTH